MTDRLLHWAEAAPDRTFWLAQAGADGSTATGAASATREALAARARDRARRCSTAGSRPSGRSRSSPTTTSSTRCSRSAALLAGVPYARSRRPTRWSRQDYDKLRHVLGTLTPGLVFAERRRALRQGDRRRGAGRRRRSCSAEGTLDGRATHAVRRLCCATAPTPRGRRGACTRPARTPSPSSCSPRARPSCPRRVINTQRMWCANQQRSRQSLAGAGRRAAGAGRLAALEPHLRRQPQRRHHALQRRHALHRRRQADAGADRRDAAQPARDRADDLLQRADGLRGDRQRASKADAGAAQDLLSRVQMFFYLRRRRWRSRSGTSCDARRREAESASASRMVHRPGHDRDRAVRDLRHQRARGEVRPHRPAGARHRAEAGARRGGKIEVRYRGPNVTPGYWRAPEADGRVASTTKASSAPATPCSRSTRPTSDRGLHVRRPHRRGLQARPPAPSSASARCARRSSPPATRCVQDVVHHRHQPQRGRRADLPALDACRALAGLPAERAGARRARPARRCARFFQQLVDALHASGTGSATRVARAPWCWPSRRRSTRARSPTRARSTSAPC